MCIRDSSKVEELRGNYLVILQQNLKFGTIEALPCAIAAGMVIEKSLDFTYGQSVLSTARALGGCWRLR